MLAKLRDPAILLCVIKLGKYVTGINGVVRIECASRLSGANGVRHLCYPCLHGGIWKRSLQAMR